MKEREKKRGRERHGAENKRKRNSEREELLRNGIVAFDVCKGYLWIREHARARRGASPILCFILNDQR